MDISNRQAADQPTYDNSQDRRPDIVVASAVSLTLAVLSTIGRVVARRRVRAPLQADDFLIFSGLFMAVAVVASTLVMMRFGLGRHIDLVVNPPALAQAVLASQILYALSVIPIKLSILALYHRLFPAPRLKWACYGIGGITVAYSVILALGFGLQCVPLSHIWMPNEPAVCIQADIMYTVMAVVNVLTDFIILGLPIPYIWRLSLQKARKIQLIAVFLLGALVCAFGIIRAVAVGTASIVDQSWTNVDGAVWSEVEICIGVVSANLPCLRPLFFWLPSAIRGSTGTNQQHKYPLKRGPSYYGGGGGGSSSKRQSNGHAGAGAFEMARRSRVIGGGGWDDIDTRSDIQPFATAEATSEPMSPDDKRRTISMTGHHVRSASRLSDGSSGSTSDPKMKPAMSRGRSPDPKPQNIVVETTIETSYENSLQARH